MVLLLDRLTAIGNVDTTLCVLTYSCNRRSVSILAAERDRNHRSTQ